MYRSVSRMSKQSNNLIRILIVDDHPVVCSGLTNMLSAQAGLEVIGSAASGDEALAMIQHDNPDLILLDLRMPGMDGIGVLHALKRDGSASAGDCAHEL